MSNLTLISIRDADGISVIKCEFVRESVVASSRLSFDPLANDFVTNALVTEGN